MHLATVGGTARDRAAPAMRCGGGKAAGFHDPAYQGAMPAAVLPCRPALPATRFNATTCPSPAARDIPPTCAPPARAASPVGYIERRCGLGCGWRSRPGGRLPKRHGRCRCTRVAPIACPRRGRAEQTEQLVGPLQPVHCPPLRLPRDARCSSSSVGCRCRRSWPCSARPARRGAGAGCPPGRAAELTGPAAAETAAAAVRDAATLAQAGGPTGWRRDAAAPAQPQRPRRAGQAGHLQVCLSEPAAHFRAHLLVQLQQRTARAPPQRLSGAQETSEAARTASTSLVQAHSARELTRGGAAAGSGSPPRLGPEHEPWRPSSAKLGAAWRSARSSYHTGKASVPSCSGTVHLRPAWQERLWKFLLRLPAVERPGSLLGVLARSQHALCRDLGASHRLATRAVRRHCLLAAALLSLPQVAMQHSS